MKWLAPAAALIALLSAVVDLAVKLERSEHRVEESRESCGDAVSQLARFAAECSERCMGE